MKISVSMLKFTLVILPNFLQFSSQSGMGTSSKSSSASSSRGYSKTPALLRGYLSKPIYLFPAHLLKVPLFDAPFGYVEVKPGVLYKTLANRNRDVFGIFTNEGKFQRFFDIRTDRQVSINMKKSQEGITPLNELNVPEIEYLIQNFGPLFPGVPRAFQVGLEIREYFIPGDHVLVSNKRNTHFDPVSPNVYKTLANKHGEVYGIYVNGEFLKLFDSIRKKPAAMDVNYIKADGRYELRELDVLEWRLIHKYGPVMSAMTTAGL